MYIVPHGPLEADRDDHSELFLPPGEAIQPAIQESWQEEAIAGSLAGNEQAFARIVDAYGALLLRTAFLLLRDEEMAKDVVQDAFFLAWKHLATLHDPALLRPWLLRIVVNQTMSLKRRLARQAMLLRERLSRPESLVFLKETAFAAARVEDWLDILEALAELPLNQRVVLVLFYYHRLTMPEIAVLLDVAENTLRKRLQAALKNIRRRLRVEALAPQPQANTLEPQDGGLPSTQQGGE